jgi:benzoyl-CoA reductase/2-hydroxyglutaryl-CoA dehydratase subunit BcrC/BadD/HgdB
MTKKLDEIEEYIRQNAGFEVIKGSLDKILNNFIDALDKVNENIEVNNAYNFAKEELSKVELKIPSNPIKVAIIGEMYEVLDQYANHFLEKELANYNIIVYRDLALSRMMFKDIRPEILKKLQPYVKYEAGASTVYTIDQALKYAKEHIDGIIHLKSFGCTPECDMMPVIQNIAQDYKIPVLFLSKDTQTSTTGLKTRLEAFVDMLIRKK